MIEMTITCSRCNTVVNGMLSDSIKSIIVTSGFYQVDKGYWSAYAEPHEKYLCDTCMFKTPKYIKTYGRY